MKNAKKVLIITSHFPPNKGGVETGMQYLLDFIEDSKNISATVVTYEKRHNNPFIDYWRNSKIIRVKVPKTTLEFMTGLKSVSRLNTLPKKTIYLSLHIYYLFKGCMVNKHEIRESNVIIARGAVVESVAGYLVSLFNNKKLSIRWQTDVESFLSNPILKIVLKRCFMKASKIVANGEDNAKQIINLLEDDSKNKITVAKQPIDLNIFYPCDLHISRKSLDLPDKTFIILFAAALNETKFCHELIDVAYKLISTNSKDFFFVFIGEGPFEKKVNQLYHRYPDNILFKNKFISQQELASFMNSSDVIIGTADICYPSRIVFEALSCGVPVLLINSSIHEAKRGSGLRFSINLPQIFKVNSNPEDMIDVLIKKFEQITEIRKNEMLRMLSHEYIRNKYSKQKVIKNEIEELS